MKLSKQKNVKRQPGLPGPRSEDWGAFYRQLREIRESGGGSVRIFVKTKKNMPPRSAKLSIEEAVEQWDSLTLFKDGFGAGLYYTVVYGTYGELVGEYEFLMGEPEDEEEWEDEDSEDEYMTDINKKIIERLIDAL